MTFVTLLMLHLNSISWPAKSFPFHLLRYLLLTSFQLGLSFLSISGFFLLYFFFFFHVTLIDFLSNSTQNTLIFTHLTYYFETNFTLNCKLKYGLVMNRSSHFEYQHGSL